MEKLLKYLMLMIVATFSLTFTACGGDDDDSMMDNIVGIWYDSNQSPASGKWAYLNVTFNADKTGSLEYDAPSHYSVAYFKYSISGNKVKCKGAYANTYGESESDFSVTFRSEGDKLIPESRYTQFQLKRLR